MCPSAPRVCSEPGGQKPVLSLSLDLIDKEEITLLFPRQREISAQTGQTQIIPKGFIPKIKSGSQACISNIVMVSSKCSLQDGIHLSWPWFVNVHCFFFCFQEALAELEELKQIVPKESLVYFLIGKVSAQNEYSLYAVLLLYIQKMLKLHQTSLLYFWQFRKFVISDPISYWPPKSKMHGEPGFKGSTW